MADFVGMLTGPTGLFVEVAVVGVVLALCRLPWRLVSAVVASIVGFGVVSVEVGMAASPLFVPVMIVVVVSALTASCLRFGVER